MNSKNDQLVESFDPVYSVFRLLTKKLVERALKICKKILKIWKKSGTRVNTWGIQKKRPKKSWTSKKIQTNEFVAKNNRKSASGGWRPPGDLGRNKYSDLQIKNPTSLLPIFRKTWIRERRRRRFFLEL